MKNKILFLILSGLFVNSLLLNAQVGIGTETPDKATIFDIESDEKGLLIPRVDLTARDLDLDGDSYQPEGLMVYNIGSTFPRGYYYWNGSEWRVWESNSSVPPTIAELLCEGATLSPSVYYSGSPYIGTLKIPYTGGSGGRFEGGTSVTANGLTFELQGGKLEVGSGELVFNVTGDPENSSPAATSFPVNSSLISFYKDNCTVTVGDQINADIKNIAVMGPLTYTTEGRAGYATVIDTPDGKFSIRCFLPVGNTFASVSLQIRSNSSTAVDIMANEAWMWGGMGGNEHNQLRLPPNQWCGSGTSTSALQNASVQSATNFESWGNEGVYASNRPEQRHYSFTAYDTNEKEFYNMRFTMGSSTPGSVANETNCPGGTCSTTKVFFTIEQITAP